MKSPSQDLRAIEEIKNTLKDIKITAETAGYACNTKLTGDTYIIDIKRKRPLAVSDVKIHGNVGGNYSVDLAMDDHFTGGRVHDLETTIKTTADRPYNPVLEKFYEYIQKHEKHSKI